MRHKIIAFLAIFTSILFAESCGDATHQETVASARTSIESGNYKMAARSIEAAVKSLDDKQPSVNELSELAMLTMMIADLDPEAADASDALNLYARACMIDADSVELFIYSLPRDEAQYLVMLRNLQRARVVNASSDFPEEPADDSEYSENESGD